MRKIAAIVIAALAILGTMGAGIDAAAAAAATVTPQHAQTAAQSYGLTCTAAHLEQHTATAWKFYETEPSLTYTRWFIEYHGESVEYLGSLEAPETTDLDALCGDAAPYLGVYDTTAHEWHLYGLGNPTKHLGAYYLENK